ncbi:hypothetical protein HAX54_035202 [Datura stramonium]|uniref:Uncharacterized protein n=1 Tax=Datura stramonium TaxID=4076 RepID=A0ABS8VF17_DATST|nr:hypothetical protein [Datura stramonium]
MVQKKIKDIDRKINHIFKPSERPSAFEHHTGDLEKIWDVWLESILPQSAKERATCMKTHTKKALDHRQCKEDLESLSCFLFVVLLFRCNQKNYARPEHHTGT